MPIKVPPKPEEQPAILRYANQFYEIILESAKIETFDEGQYGLIMPGEYLVFRGKVTDVYKQLKASQTYYARIRKLLINNGCVTFVERGARGSVSVLVLHHPPPPLAEIPPENLTTRPTFDTLSRRLERLENSLGGISIVEALVNMETRIAKLERLLRKRENGESNGSQS